MQTFKIPVTWSVYGTIEIQADTIEDAIKKFEENKEEIPLPYDSDYIDNSFQMDPSPEELIHVYEMYQ